MRNSVIVAINHSLRDNASLQKHLRNYTYGRCGTYDVYKLFPKKVNSSNPVGVAITILMCADAAFDISSKQFVKSRFGTNISSFPGDLYRMYGPVLNITENLPSMDDLLKSYDKMDIIKAIYLTGTIENYRNRIDELEYQMIRYKHGREVPDDILKQIIEKFPEKLI